MKINLIPFKQERDATCVPACLKIVLHYFGDESLESTLVKACRTDNEGTGLADAAKAMRLRGYNVIELNDADLFELVDHLTQGRPIIVALEVRQLSYGESGIHAVVICGFDNNRVHFIDPASGREKSLDLVTFFSAWEARSRSGLVIYPKTSS